MDIRHINLTFARKDKTIIMGGSALDDTPYKIFEIAGFESSDYEISLVNNAQLPGSVVAGTRVAARPMTIIFELPNNIDFSVYRQELIQFFTPEEQGTLIVDYNGLKRNIPYYVDGFKFQNSNLYENLQAGLDLICPQPFFLDMDSYGKNIASKTPLFAFPLFIPRSSGRAMSYKTLKQNVSLPNHGDVDTGIEIEFKATRGAVTNPKIEKVTTGQYVRAVADMKQGDVLKINTNAGKQRIELNGENIFHKIDRTSTFFKINVGDNILKYSADDNYTNLDVYLFYTPKYLGV